MKVSGSSSRFGYRGIADRYEMGGGQKISDLVDFPLEGLDLGKYMQGQKDQNMIYDLYAVSNHYGNMGFGHYTAYAKNPKTDKWYDFDDSQVKPVRPERTKDTVVGEAAYNLFYRRRDWHQKNKENGCDFEALALKPDMASIGKK